jgi:hypothetical protein
MTANSSLHDRGRRGFILCGMTILSQSKSPRIICWISNVFYTAKAFLTQCMTYVCPNSEARFSWCELTGYWIKSLEIYIEIVYLILWSYCTLNWTCGKKALLTICPSSWNSLKIPRRRRKIRPTRGRSCVRRKPSLYYIEKIEQFQMFDNII